MFLYIVSTLLISLLKKYIHRKISRIVRLDSDPDIHKQPREEAEMTMHELTTLAQHTSVSLLDSMVLIAVPTFPCFPCLLVDVYIQLFLPFCCCQFPLHTEI